MSEPFEMVKEGRIQYRYKHKLEMIIDNLELFNLKDFNLVNMKYILIVKPEEETKGVSASVEVEL